MRSVLFLVVYFCLKVEAESDGCVLELVESIPVGLEYPEKYPKYLSTTQAWLNLIQNTKTSLDIASYYWTMQESDVVSDPSAADGEAVFAALLDKAGLLRIAKSASGDADPDSEILEQHGAQFRTLDMPKLIGSGVLHTKALISNDRDFYLGSANMDWRSLTQVKELGILGRNCSKLAQDLGKIFSVYWLVGTINKIPENWPQDFETGFNVTHPMDQISESIQYSAYFSSSPPVFSPNGRTKDISAVLSTIRSAEKFVHIAVMDYFPLFLYREKLEFWGVIDDELRSAYINRHVNVKLLVANWPHTREYVTSFVNSLTSLNSVHNQSSIQVKYFTVPSNASFDHIPYSRVNHNKYMITEKSAFIGTSNWSADYFTDTAGISLILSTPDEILQTFDCNTQSKKAKKSINEQLAEIFQRDWCSQYATFEKPAN